MSEKMYGALKNISLGDIREYCESNDFREILEERYGSNLFNMVYKLMLTEDGELKTFGPMHSDLMTALEHEGEEVCIKEFGAIKESSTYSIDDVISYMDIDEYFKFLEYLYTDTAYEGLIKDCEDNNISMDTIDLFEQYDEDKFTEIVIYNFPEVIERVEGYIFENELQSETEYIVDSAWENVETIFNHLEYEKNVGNYQDLEL